MVSTHTAFPTLLSPLTLGTVELRNRVVSTAHGAFLDFYRPGEPGERYIAYQERRARGGTALIILQPVHVHHTSQAAGHYIYDAEDLRPKLREMSRRLHRHDTRVIVQLLHFGGAFRSDSASDLEPLWSFSPFVSPTGSEAVHEMTGAEIDEVISGYVATAALAVESGLDGVELQASHGYLVQQSLSPWSNQRTDEWGQPTRFASAIIHGIRDAVGRDPLLGVRLSVDDWIKPEHGGLGAAAVREIAEELVAGGQLDFLNVSAGARASHYSRSIGSYRHAPAPLLSLTAELRASVGAAVPVIGVSRILTPELAERALQEHACDLVGMTRAQIADPDLVAKLSGAPGAPIRPCVSANQGCVDRQQGGLPITCFHNPEVGQEHASASCSQAPRRVRVLVVGGGPAGMKAAEIAARRGHAVTPRRARRAARRSLALGRGVRRPARTAEVDRLARGRAPPPRGDGAAAAPRSPPTAARSGPGRDRAGHRRAAGSRAARRPETDRSAWSRSRMRWASARPARTCWSSTTWATRRSRWPRSDSHTTPVRLTLITPMQSVGPHIGFTLIKDQLMRLYAAGARWSRARPSPGSRTGRCSRATSTPEPSRGAASTRSSPASRGCPSSGCVLRRWPARGRCSSPATRWRRGRRCTHSGRATRRGAP